MHNESKLTRNLSTSKILTYAPSFILSLAVTENFFKFRSFSLELVGFGLLWAGLYGAQAMVTNFFKK